MQTNKVQVLKLKNDGEDMNGDFSLDIRQDVVKGVFGKSLDKKKLSVFRKKFQLHANHLINLTVSEYLLPVLVCKLFKQDYVVLKTTVSPHMLSYKMLLA